MSDSRDPAHPFVDGLTLSGILRWTAARFPDRDAAVFCHLGPDGRTPLENATRNCFRSTWREFDADVDRAARSLIALGIRKGEHVAVWATNRPEWLLLQFGCARIGAVLVNINPAYRAHELGYVLRQSDSAVLFLIDRFRTSDYSAMFAEAVRDVGAAEYPMLRHVVSMSDAVGPGMIAWEEFLALGERVSPEELADRERGTHPDEPVNMQYTSGTTGFPKGGDAGASQPASERLACRSVPVALGAGSDVRAAAVLSLLRLRAGNAVRGRLWRGADRAGGAL